MVVDNNTFKISFPKPYGGFVYEMGFWMRNYDWLVRPAHYLRQFHPKYTSMDELEKLIRELELLRRKRAGSVRPSERDRTDAAIQLTIGGIAAGLRNTG